MRTEHKMSITLDVCEREDYITELVGDIRTVSLRILSQCQHKLCRADGLRFNIARTRAI